MPQKKETWVEIAIKVHGDLVDAVSNFMTEIGALGVYEESLEPQDGSDFAESRPEAAEPLTEETIKAYLLKDNRLNHRLASLDAYIHSLGSLFPDHPRVAYTIQIVNDADWAEGWKKYFKPIRVTKNIIIKPTWERYAAVGHDIVIEMDPGMAFGTGQHASTRMCLEALENIILHEKTAQPGNVLDIGSGTGILGIAAAKLGAKKVTCIDIDPLATEISLENIKINHVEDRVEALTQDVSALDGAFDLIVANLTAKVLIKQRSHIISLLSEGGFLIISGIIEQNREDIETHFLADPFVSPKTLTEKEWLCYILKKETHSR
ncbi:MAG: Ribosomal protein L11 methyltransferase [Syntrophus sp. SKADARSKE-3]|nr:Ribosomal protein L11 methyltransferase [Syntrophus sp. SKADARSKE-3]